jgi:hypothetical protein
MDVVNKRAVAKAPTDFKRIIRKPPSLKPIAVPGWLSVKTRLILDCKRGGGIAAGRRT